MTRHKIKTENKNGVIHVSTEIPNIKIPPIPSVLQISEPEYLKFTIEQIQAMSDERLLKILNGENPGESENLVIPVRTIMLINTEIQKRNLNKASQPHFKDWLLKPFFAGVLISVVSLLILDVPVFKFRKNRKKPVS